MGLSTKERWERAIVAFLLSAAVVIVWLLVRG
jgi:hypothetical protein